MKSVEQRIAECVSIRQQLQSYGILSIPDVATKLAQHTNEFIKNGTAQTFVLNPHVGSYEFRIILTTKEGKQSGVEVIR